MYTWLAIDSVLRITFAMVVLFVVLPRLCRTGNPACPDPGRDQPDRQEPDRQDCLSYIWFDFAWGVVVLTIAGQLLTLVNLYALPTLLLVCALVILAARSIATHRSPLTILGDARRWVAVAGINVLERRASVARRMRRSVRHALAWRPPRIALGWIAVALVAAVLRLYRPFATANLGYSDSYVHLYLLKLLDQGRQVDPAWGPYPRGMHFLLLAIQRLTNIDEILLVNFFGAFAGVLIALSVAYTAKRLARSNAAGIVAGLLFATMIGGAKQYFLVGGSFEGADLSHKAYAALPQDGPEFDVLLTVFQRQSSTLSQELAIVFLFPAALFLLDWLERKDRWHLMGFIGCTAAIAATHSGVLVPLVLLCAVVALAVLATRRATVREVARGALAGAAAIGLGSTWMLGFIAYPRAAPGSHVGNTIAFYFPFLRGDAAGGTGVQEVRALNTITPFLIALAIVAAALALFRHRERSRATWVGGGAPIVATSAAPAARPGRSTTLGMTVAAGAFLVFLLIHASSRLGLPEVVESRRNAEWFVMAIAILAGVALSRVPKGGGMAAALQVAAVAAWLFTIPAPSTLRDRLLNYSGYGTASLAVVEIAHKLEPFSWTLISYGQEYPMVLGRGFHLTAAQFLDRYDPASPDLTIPTRYVFVLTERVPHRFEVLDWRTKFSRRDVEHRLETWCQLYRATHDDLRVFLDDGNVQVYEIARSQSEANRIAKEARVQ